MTISKKGKTAGASQSTTLHHFFGRTATPQPKKAPMKPKISEPRSKGKQRELPPPEEIIVISDSDGEPSEQNSSSRDKQLLASKRRQVQVDVDASASKRKKNFRSPSVSIVDDYIDGASNTREKPSLSPMASLVLDAPNVSPFGIPTTLLVPSNPRCRTPRCQFVSEGISSIARPSSVFESPLGVPSTLPYASDYVGGGPSSERCSPSPSRESFGVPTTLLRPSSHNISAFPSSSISGLNHGMEDSSDSVSISDRVLEDEDAQSKSYRLIYSPPPPPSRSEMNNIDSVSDEFETNEEWGLGDDELTLLDEDPEDDGNDEDIDELDSGETKFPDDIVGACPVCSMQFKDYSLCSIQNHVNSCINTPRSAIPSNGPRQLARFSTHQKADGKNPDSKPSANAFSVLMSSHKENEAWKEASMAEDRNFRPTKQNGGRRKAPFYKVLQGMPIAVDAFRYGTIPGVTAYFLTHAHSDHYTNLSSNWKSGPIYCSEGTANLIIHMLDVDPKWIHPLPLDIPSIIPDTGGVQVTLIEANHCPGSCLFLFEGPQTMDAGDSAYKSSYIGSSRIFRYLHCGDFRASPKHVLHPAVKGKRIDHVYLDTTYLDPKYCFPPQPLVISACADLALRIVSGCSGHGHPAASKVQSHTVTSWLTSPDKSITPTSVQTSGKVLVVVGTYSIGKERIVKAIAKALNSKVYCDKRKAAILRCQSDPELHDLLTSNPLDAIVHVVPLSIITSDRLKEYVERFKGHFDKAVGFRPTGWTYTPPNGSDTLPSISTVLAKSRQRQFTYTSLSPMRNSTLAYQLYGVPYSEHSSFFELTCFALSFDWGKMIATVNVGSERSRARMRRWVELWEKDRRVRAKDGIVSYREPEYW